MEIAKSIKDQAIARLLTANPDAGLNTVLNELDDFEIEKLLDSKNGPLINQDRILHALHSGLMTKDEALRVDVLTGYFKSMLDVLDYAFKKTNASKLLAFLMAYAYFPIPFNSAVTMISPGDELKKSLSKEIDKILDSIKYDFVTLPGAPYYETTLLAKAKEAANQSDIAGVYHLIKAIERSERGMHWNFLLEKIIKFQFYLNQTGFVNRLQDLKDPFTAVNYMNSLELDELLLLAEAPIKNPWVNFELIRLINKASKTIAPIHQQAIEKKLDALYIQDKEFFIQTIQYFAGSNLVLSAFGSLCRILPATFIKEVFQKCFPLDQYHMQIDSHTALLESLQRSVDEEKLKSVLAEIYQLWRDFTLSVLDKDDYFQSGTLLTNFANYISAHYFHNLDNSEIISEMSRLLDSIKYLECEWFTSASKQITKYHWYSSMLYILTFPYKDKGIHDLTITTKLQALMYDAVQISRYRRTTDKLTIELAYENVFGTTLLLD